MYPISSGVMELFEAEQNQVLRITGTDKNGTAITITDANVVINGFNIDRYSCNGEKLEVGTAIASELTLRLDNGNGQFNGIVFEGAELFVEVGIADWTQDDPTITWIPCGYFTPDEQPRSLSTITIHALDRMMRFDAVPPILTPWVDNNGNVITTNTGEPIYFMAEITLPTTIAGLVNQVCLRCGVTVATDLATLPNYNYTLTEMPVLQQQITFRNIIQWCAGIMGTNAWMDWNGQLRFTWYGANTGYTTTVANRFNSDLYEDDITITGVQYTNTQNATIIAGDADYTIDMTGNYLAATGIAQILPAVKNVVAGFTYRPFSASVINAPYLWPMDMITFTKDGVDHTCAVTNVNFGINGNTQLQGKGETAQTNSGTSPNGMTNTQAFIVEKAVEAAVDNIERALDQDTIFNILTNNGEAQGMYLIDGQVYVNMTYARSGTLLLGGLNNTNGLLKVLDATGQEIGVWDKDGINLNKGTIAGPSITLGGANNANGSLQILDGNGNQIGTWDKDGISASAGTFRGRIIGGTIFGSTLYIGGGTTDEGALIIRNQYGIVIGRWDKDGIFATTGTFSGALNGATGTFVGEVSADSLVGGTFTVGGENDGAILVLDSNGQKIGSWDKNGIDIFDGDISLGPTSTLEQIFDINGVKMFSIDGEGGFYLRNGNDDIRLWYNDFVAGISYPELIIHEGSNRLVNLSSREFNVKLSGSLGLQYNKDGCFVIIGYRSLYVNPTSSSKYIPDYNGTYTLVDANTINWEGNLKISGNLSVSGTKPRLVTTDQYGKRFLYCYETPTPMFGDIGEGVIAEDGQCYVWLDPVFAQAITTDQYQVFLQRYGEGECYVKDRKAGYFIVAGTHGLQFGWEIKAKQRDYDQLRLDKDGDKFEMPAQSYGADAAQHIEDIQKERISA